jgi:hypothetical protein
VWIWCKPRLRQELVEGVEELGGLDEGGVGFADDFGFGGFEGLFGGDAVEPALVGKLFVVGEIEANEKADAAGGGGIISLFTLRGFLFRRGRFCGGGFWLGGGVLGRIFALEFQEELIAEAEALLPAFELVAGLLGGVFVRAEIEN